MISRLPFSRKILMVVAIPILALVALAGTSFSTIQSVKVGSKNFQRSESAQVLVADLLPPPLYLVETWAEVNYLQDTANADEIKQHKQVIDRAEKDYTERFGVWSRDSTVINDALRASVLETSDRAARQFFKVIHGKYYAALDAGKTDEVRKILVNDLKPLYDEHRAAVVTAVAQANRVKTDADASSRSLVNQRVLLSALVFLGSLGLAIAASFVVVRSIRRSIAKVRDGANDVVRTLSTTDLDTEVPKLAPVEVDSDDELGDAAGAFNSVVGTTVSLLERQRQARQKTSELFVNLGRRNQNLVTRQLRLIDELEHSDADQEVLTKIFKIDHIATRMRRNAESLLVMAGLETPRRWKNAVAVSDVLRSTISEIEQFDRVEVGNLPQVRISGKAAADVSHLLAELVENAVRYSPPDARVHVSGRISGDGRVRISIVDQGTGMIGTELEQAMERLAGTQQIEQMQTAYLGHFVVGRLAARHGITVRLDSPGGEGLTAHVELPEAILSEMAADPGTQLQREGRSRAARPAPAPAPATEAVRRPAPPAPMHDGSGQSAAPAAAPRRPQMPRQPHEAPRLDVPPMARPAAAPGAGPQPSRVAQPAPAAVPQPVAEADEFTNAGYRKRTRKPVADASLDRFATPDTAATPRSNDAMRNRLSNFSAGKSRAATADEPVAAAAVSGGFGHNGHDSAGHNGTAHDLDHSGAGLPYADHDTSLDHIDDEGNF